jgi:Rieske Fe-S protein
MRLDPARIIVPPDLQERVTAGGLVALFNTCTHLCCNSGSHFINPGGTNMVSPVPAEDVLAHPNYTLSGLPVVAPDIGIIDCPCHDAQFDPFRLVWANHPNGVRYLGANWVWGPARRALPVIPLEVSGTTMRGLNTHPEWHTGYCGL